MMHALAELFRRDLTRLAQEIEAFPDEVSLWATLPGVKNSAGNLALHLEGNLRHYIGFHLGGVAYSRVREREFGDRGLGVAELTERIRNLQPAISEIVEGLTASQLASVFPERLWGGERTTSQFVCHLYGHFNYHLGQIGYLRRILTAGTAVEFVQL